MPEAEPFTALGRGNGLPFCPFKRNVSSFDYWVTLGNYKKTDADADVAVTQTEINLSLTNAMKLFWNLNSMDSTANWAGSGTYDPPPTVSNPELSQEPIERVCLGAGESQGNGRIVEYISGELVSVAMSLKIVRMYNGVTTDEDNFVGYGVDRGATSSSDAFRAYGNIGNGEAEVGASSWGDAYTFRILDDAGYTEISGIPFFARAASLDNPPNTNGSVSLSPLRAQITSSFGTTTAEITGFDFYTYP